MLQRMAETAAPQRRVLRENSKTDVAMARRNLLTASDGLEALGETEQAKRLKRLAVQIAECENELITA